ncbi:MAG TPA: hypothetical protein VEB69_01640 [Acidimicrobiia bacterium]|nr:hypothetical protein [Acidimicrobiia bacterium]
MALSTTLVGAFISSSPSRYSRIVPAVNELGISAIIDEPARFDIGDTP